VFHHAALVISPVFVGWSLELFGVEPDQSRCLPMDGNDKAAGLLGFPPTMSRGFQSPQGHKQNNWVHNDSRAA
jgi:hypothetical protein